jgi:hypothetical protein
MLQFVSVGGEVAWGKGVKPRFILPRNSHGIGCRVHHKSVAGQASMQYMLCLLYV